MKILGHTPEGDLIIQVSKKEYEDLQAGKLPDLEDRFKQFEYTEAGKFLAKIHNLRGKWVLQLQYTYGEFDGTMKSLWAIANDEIHVPHMGEKS
jgi:hypothetical protein